MYALIIDHEEVRRDEYPGPLLDLAVREVQINEDVVEIRVRLVRPGYVPDCGHRAYGNAPTCKVCSVMECRNYVVKRAR